ncbi:hypothetical protein T4B_10696 [Trichinella pseudospiralis]|uniref:Uncharacterized protein n=1 Tax=Trichinella pseudospiralis TaxID=6337 RepID=A0A0V1HJ63_TRIPS|nr:hypothetical protein T4B_10696 [Trichinella pseudospiralis]KRZ39208.1 hypothetical protein T4C_10667 [Trichinella pseudospiralis]
MKMTCYLAIHVLKAHLSCTIQHCDMRNCMNFVYATMPKVH